MSHDQASHAPFGLVTNKKNYNVIPIIFIQLPFCIISFIVLPATSTPPCAVVGVFNHHTGISLYCSVKVKDHTKDDIVNLQKYPCPKWQYLFIMKLSPSTS